MADLGQFPRQRYGNPPIREAVCEFRFLGADWNPTIPGHFHDHIKAEFAAKPKEVRAVETRMTAGADRPTEFAVENLPPKTQFGTSDGRHLITIGPGTLSISELQPYTSWEDFHGRIVNALEAFQSVVDSKTIARVGVRYINWIDIPSTNNVTNLHDYFTCAPQDLSEETGSIHLPRMMLGVLSQQMFRYEDGSILSRVFATRDIRKDDYLGTLLDIDCYRAGIELDVGSSELTDVLDSLKRREGVAFEASLKDSCRALFRQ